MKIKWKIVSASVGIIVLLTLSIVFFTQEEVNSLVLVKAVKNYRTTLIWVFNYLNDPMREAGP